MNSKKTFIGIDIGGTNTVIGLIDLKGKILIEKTFTTPSMEPFQSFMTKLDKELTAIFNQSEIFPSGIGVGMPGANFKTGMVDSPENFNWDHINIPQLISKKYNLPVKIMNDADAAAQGELSFGIAQDLKNFIHITLGTGLGSSIIVNGKIITGHSGIAGELGHTKIYSSNRMCSCGKRGCLETYVSANGIRRTVFELLSTEQTDSVLRELSFQQLSPKIISDLVLKGDSIAIKTYQYTGRILGEKLANVIGLLSPEAIVFSGGLVAAGSSLFDPMKISIEENLLQMHKNSVEIRFSDPNRNYAILGAASLLM